ncbi:MAG: hypothetical protein FWH19_03340 [Treponema sp.]|nr:hypothetical protein [Treponema sp.]
MKLKNLGRAILCIFLLSALLSSCSTRIDGALLEGGQANLSLVTSLEPRTLALVSNLRSFLGAAGDGPVLDGPAIANSMAAAAGMTAVSLRNTSPSALEGNISIGNVGDFLAIGGEESRFINYVQGSAPGSSSIVINLDRIFAPQIISRLSPEITEYLSALMAPALLGVSSSRQEYLDLLAMIYGRPLADEIASAYIRARIEFPRPLRSVYGGNASGRMAEFDIILLDLLVLEEPLKYEAIW